MVELNESKPKRLYHPVEEPLLVSLELFRSHPWENHGALNHLLKKRTRETLPHLHEEEHAVVYEVIPRPTETHRQLM